MRSCNFSFKITLEFSFLNLFYHLFVLVKNEEEPGEAATGNELDEERAAKKLISELEPDLCVDQVSYGFLFGIRPVVKY